jgi:hypothetical protein
MPSPRTITKDIVQVVAAKPGKAGVYDFDTAPPHAARRQSLLEERRVGFAIADADALGRASAQAHDSPYVAWFGHCDLGPTKTTGVGRPLRGEGEVLPKEVRRVRRVLTEHFARIKSLDI